MAQRAPAEKPTVALTIDGRPVIVPQGTTVWHAAKTIGIDIPIFCYHDRMPPLGACRQCLVRVEKQPRYLTSCTLLAEQGMVVHATTPEVREAQEMILEYLLINHPLDCPICDKGGECPLQDQAYLYGPGRSRFVEPKRDFAKPVSLGPLLVLDRERCVLCWRCVRFGEIVAGDHALKGFERGFASEINTPFTEPVESKFIGNTISICPVGALTSRTYRFLSRPWDNAAVPSICNHCGLGCATWLDVRDETITRVRPREHPAVNDVWLCDLGQFGYEWVGSRDRLTRPLIRRDGALVESSWAEALDLIAAALKTSRRLGPGRVGVLGGARLSNEEAYLVRRFFREVVGTPHIDHRTDTRPGSPSLEVPWGMRAPLEAISSSSLLLLVGCDVTEEYPIAWLWMKRAVDRGTPLCAIAPTHLEIEPYLTAALLTAPGAEGAVLAQVATGVEGRPLDEALLGAAGVEPAAVRGLADRLRTAVRPMLFLGRGALEGAAGPGILGSAQRLQAAGCMVHVMRGKGNAFGAALMGLLPGPSGWTAPEMLRQGAAGELDVLYVAGADPATDVPDASAWTAARQNTAFVVVQDLFLTETARSADVVLPTLAYAEKDGTVCNLEWRVQRIQAAVRAPGEARGEGQVIADLARRLGVQWSTGSWQEIFEDAAAEIPGLAEGAVLSPPPLAGSWPADGGLPTRPGDLVLVTGERLFDRGSMTGRSPAIAELAGTPSVWLHPSEATARGLGEGALAEVSTSHGRLVLRVRVTDRVPPGVASVPRSDDAVPATRLLNWEAPLIAVSLRPLNPVAQTPEGAAAEAAEPAASPARTRGSGS
jgi:NADH-quinone oxidoreductase subunit G